MRSKELFYWRRKHKSLISTYMYEIWDMTYIYNLKIIIGFPPNLELHPFYNFGLFEPCCIQDKSSFFQGNSSEWSCKIKCWSILSLQFNLKQRKVQIPGRRCGNSLISWHLFPIQIHSIKGLIVDIRISTISLYQYLG